MDSVAVTVPLRQPMKKMKKRKELDALAPAHAVSRRSSGKRSSQELLTDSSDDRSEYSGILRNVSIRGGRKCRGRRGQACPGFLKACNAFLACASVLATASLIWLFIDVRQQLTALRTELDQVIAGSEGVPDALQKCHSLSRDLQNNQTIIFSRLSDLKQQINNYTLAHIQQDLHKVQEYFQTAPEMATLPKRLNELSASVATFGSQINDLGATVKTLKETNVRIQDAQTAMQQNVSSIKQSMLELSNITQKPQILSTDETQVKIDKLNFTVSHLMNNLTHVNKTFSSKLQWVADDQDEDRRKLVSLQEATAAINTTVMSLQGECVKISEQASVLASIQQLTEKVSEIRATDVELIGKFKQLEQSYNGLKNSTSIMFATVSEIQNQQQVNKIKLSEPLSSDITTETDRGATDVNDIVQKKILNET
ncbi:EF-hand calcium-binding domain-containing protein 14 isoform X2 [Polyergus mexicanus]|uniref:EF-hand calcium-binding domain-containing protein 14 isoform X2 n=1 Tax=Polyergus mexicanus TaxID=615972 RepID=UPI0038B544FB